MVFCWLISFSKPNAWKSRKLIREKLFHSKNHTIKYTYFHSYHHIHFEVKDLANKLLRWNWTLLPVVKSTWKIKKGKFERIAVKGYNPFRSYIIYNTKSKGFIESLRIFTWNTRIEQSSTGSLVQQWRPWHQMLLGTLHGSQKVKKMKSEWNWREEIGRLRT